MLSRGSLAKGACQQAVSNISNFRKIGMGRLRHYFVALVSYFK
jgi:hypothetical protein